MADYPLLVQNDLRNVFDRFEKILLNKLNCVKVGKIKTFYSDKQNADIQIDGYPLISSVPVSFTCYCTFANKTSNWVHLHVLSFFHAHIVGNELSACVDDSCTTRTNCYIFTPAVNHGICSYSRRR